MYEDFCNVGIVHISDLFDVHGNPITFYAIVQKGVAPHRWLAWHSLLACVLRKKALVSKYKGIVHESDYAWVTAFCVTPILERFIYYYMNVDMETVYVYQEFLIIWKI